MRRIVLKLVLSVVLFAATGHPVHADSSLPPCPRQAPVSSWSDCVGTILDEGGTYVGEWRAGRFEGRGVYTYPSGKRYVGGFKDDEFHGHGVLISNAGYRLVEGLWEDNKNVTVDGVRWHWYFTQNENELFITPLDAQLANGAREARVTLARVEPDEDKDLQLSIQVLMQFDCSGARFRNVTVSGYDGPFGTGRVLSQSGPAAWVKIEPDTVGVLMMQRVCSG